MSHNHTAKQLGTLRYTAHDQGMGHESILAVHSDLEYRINFFSVTNIAGLQLIMPKT